MVGRTLSHFRITATIGQGGMGVVNRGHDEKLRRTVALKVLPPGLTGDRERRSRFLREARAAAVVTHPAIVTVYGIGEADGVVHPGDRRGEAAPAGSRPPGVAVYSTPSRRISRTA